MYRGDLPKITLEDILERKSEGKTNSEIAREFGVSRQYVSKLLRKEDIYANPRFEVIKRHFPWQLTDEQQRAAPARRLRDHMVWVTGAAELDERSRLRLRYWYERLETDNTVVEFDPRFLPEPGVSLYGGFAYRPRMPQDRDLLIRVNKYTRITDLALPLGLLAFPEERP